MISKVKNESITHKNAQFNAVHNELTNSMKNEHLNNTYDESLVMNSLQQQ